jgi:hypothetical protein
MVRRPHLPAGMRNYLAGRYWLQVAVFSRVEVSLYGR